MFFFSFFFYHCFSFKAPLEKRTRLLCFPFSILFGAGRIFPLSKNKNTHVDSSASIFSLGFHFFFFLLWSFVILQKKEREKKNDAFFLSLAPSFLFSLSFYVFGYQNFVYLRRKFYSCSSLA